MLTVNQIKVSIVLLSITAIIFYTQSSASLQTGNVLTGLLTPPNATRNTIVIYPVFTELAYQQHGFYEYYGKTCGTECLTIPYHSPVYNTVAASKMGYNFFNSHGYTIVSDMVVTDHPDILKLYSTVIVLHNEYVSQKEFNAIINHPHVLYLYPNSLYAEVEYDRDTNSIYLVKGHGWPVPTVGNGFGWADDNSKYEYDRECNNWKTHEIGNGLMLDCYPETAIGADMKLTNLILGY